MAASSITLVIAINLVIAHLHLITKLLDHELKKYNYIAMMFLS